MDTGEMIHGSVDTLPHKGHKRMFLINARRSLLDQGGVSIILFNIRPKHQNNHKPRNRPTEHSLFLSIAGFM